MKKLKIIPIIRRGNIHRVLALLLPITVIMLMTAFVVKDRTKSKTKKKKNIVLIVADDLGFGDLACYGGDIETPNIDALAYKGIRFSSFHTAPMCAPTRAMLLSGNDNHIAGMGGQGTVTSEFGYEGHLTNRIIPIPELLRQGGYHTYMAGKWHLGRRAEDNPSQKGFEQSYVVVSGAGNHYLNQSALSKGLSTYTENGDTVLWKDGNYSTDFYTDKLIEYIDLNKDDEKPFFAFAAYTSPHWPLQVDEKYWKKYEGRYDDGYEELRKSRLASLKKAGIIANNVTAPPPHERVIPWDSLSQKEKMIEARKMELYAGMVDNLDHNIGRLVSHLKEIGEFDNTLFVFMSDNGAAHRDFIKNESYSHLKDFYNEDYENMGKANSYVSYGPQWAEAGSAPFRYFKDFGTQGGINTTMIICGPQVKRENVIHHGFASLLDLAPTFYEIAEVEYPKNFNGNEVYPLRGSSLIPFVSGARNEIHDASYVFALEHYGNAMLRKGDWKITNLSRPFDPKNFELYNIAEDIVEQNDLRDSEPEKYQELLAEWEKFSSEVRIQTPAPHAGSD